MSGVVETQRPTIDITDYESPRCVQEMKSSENGSYFRADPGFRHKVPSNRKVISFIDKDGLIRYKYSD